ncbi:protein-tyrosine phosphatase-like protein [Rhodocollybia butyracea]|uniref:Protein-tyrosine phosphatase-like protein n=1 Tax=Rhodocollybia butyracea TaxID=206335 RepID=A0A9P5Q6I8_9AGAR|nr:protein-tyrosine phosphatase-like protein [Rhodocollybia butyracea]
MQHPLPCPPFVDVEGVVNIRSVGRYTTTAGRAVKPNIIYRSGDVSSITERGRKQFSELGVHIVFDFRADAEIKDFDSSTPPIEGVKMIRTPAGIQRAFDPVSVAMRLKHWEENELEAFLSLYEEILETGKDAFKTVFLHLRDHPEEPCLVHCTAGKDRTGIFTTLLLLILGVEDRHIVDEYALTTIGLEPALPMLTRKMEKVAVYRENWKGMQNMGSSKPETMTAVLQLIQTKYDGAEGYFKTHLNLNGEDIAKIRKNFLVNGKSRLDFRLSPIFFTSILSIAVYLGFKYSRP